VAMGFERLLLGEEFIDRIVGHAEYDPTAGLPAGPRHGSRYGNGNREEFYFAGAAGGFRCTL
jgi:hypothetical protein